MDAIPDAFFIAVIGSRYVGYSAVAPRASEPGTIWPAGTAVAPDQRNAGIATFLKTRSIARARELGYARARSASGNPALLRINAQLGYRPDRVEVRLVRLL